MNIIRLPRDPNHEFVKVMTHAIVDKRDERYDDYMAQLLAKGRSAFEALTTIMYRLGSTR